MWSRKLKRNKYKKHDKKREDIKREQLETDSKIKRDIKKYFNS